jgi:putative hemolysin
MAEDPYPLIFNSNILQILNTGLESVAPLYLISLSLAIVVLIIFSGLFSASENAMFSLNHQDVDMLSKEDASTSKIIIKLLQQPRKLLATILIANNFVNVSLIIISSRLIDTVFQFKDKNIEFLIKVLLVTFILLLFGEVMPKVYAIKKNIKISRLMAFPLLFCQKLFTPLNYPLLRFTSFIDKRVKIHEHTVSADELTHAIDITSDSKTGIQERDILKGIVSFGNKTVRQIMKSRVDVSALDIQMNYEEMLMKVNEWGYSRFPVYDETFDNICGVLNIKEILPHLNESKNFNWKKLLKPAFYVPDTKRIDLLLAEFQEERNHMAIVVDEYGGKLGIVTMEDILEEIFGEINDEFDEEQISYSKIDNNTYIIEGKILINDFCKITETIDDYFDDIKNDSETVAGLIMELSGRIPQRDETIKYKNFSFIIEAADNRRLKRIKVVIDRP